MQEIKEVKNETAYKNGGFTLVEVIIAVIIMAIAAIPLLHAFSTTANTSSKALVKMRATHAAENIMDDIKGLTLDEVVDKYGDATVEYPNKPGRNVADGEDLSDPTNSGYVPRVGKDKANHDRNITKDNAMYEFVLTGADSAYSKDVNKLWEKSDDYIVTIQIDPTYYPNINSVNLSDFDELSSDYSAILNVDETLDKEAVDKFANLSDSLTDDKHWRNQSIAKRQEEFSKIFKREIRLDITKKGDATDSEGEEYTEVEINASVSYLLYDNTSNDYVPVGTESQRLYNRKIFSNINNENRLNSVFILFNPLYENMDKQREIVIVHNPDSVEFNLYLVAQNTASNSTNWQNYKDSNALIFELYEKDINGIEPVTLYTNIHKDIEYKRKADSSIIPIESSINLDVPFQSPEGAKDTFKDKTYRNIIKKAKNGDSAREEFTKALNAKDIDGKLLDASRVEDKIYDVIVKVTKTITEDEWPITVELTGTMVDKR